MLLANIECHTSYLKEKDKGSSFFFVLLALFFLSMLLLLVVEKTFRAGELGPDFPLLSPLKL